ncbi:MAG: hypothetical protein CUN55_00435 [Phototrophicales bacterium]|nr:MAG: hypothetical protein CUN55_00435 [Phototrophicales bacterium]
MLLKKLMMRKFQVFVLVLATSLFLIGYKSVLAQSPPTPITYGETLAGSIDAAGAEAVFLFDAASGDQITAIVSAADDTLDPVLDLTTFTRTLLATDDNSGPAGSAQITYVIPADGTYNLVVRGAGGTTGTFTISLEAGISQPTIEQPALDDSQTVNTEPTDSSPVGLEPRLQRIRIGSTVSGTLSGDASFNLYAFEGAADQEIAITPDPRTTFQPLLVLYDSSFTELARAQPSNALRISLPAADWYFVAAAIPELGVGGTFGFSVLDQAPAAQPALGEDELIYGNTVRGTITDAIPIVRYRFAGNIGDPITISMATVSGDLDAYLLLVDASGNIIAEDDNSGNNTDAQLSLELPSTSDYFIIATRRGQETGLTSGEFVLALTSSAPPRVGSVSRPPVPEEFVGLSTIDIGSTVTGRISNAVYQEFYVFYGEAGDALTITLEAAEGSELDPLLILLDQNRIPVDENDDDGDSQNSRLDVTLPQTGYYAIVATRYELAEGSTQGAYTLSLIRQGGSVEDVPPPFEQLNPIRVLAGDSPTETFTPLDFADVFTFSVAEGALIDFAVTTEDGTISTVIVTDSELNFVTASDNGVILAVTAPRSDDYLAFVAPQAGPIANVETTYSVTLSADIIRSNAEAGERIPITYGSTVRGTIDDEQPAIRYVFQGRAGDIVEISMTARSVAQPLDTLLILQDESGTTIAENDDINPGIVRDSFISIELPNDGEYTIVATRYSGTTAPITSGEFTLTLSVQDPIFSSVDRTADPIRYGETIRANINDDTKLYFFYFEGMQGDNISIEVQTLSGNLDAVMYLYAITSTGDFLLLTSNDDSPRGGTFDPYIEYTLPRTGGYVIAVTRFESPDSEPTEGEFSILLLKQS